MLDTNFCRPTARPSVYYVHRDKDTPEDTQYGLTDYRRNWKKGKVARIKKDKFCVIVRTDRDSAHHHTAAEKIFRGSVRDFLQSKFTAEQEYDELNLKSPIPPTSVSRAQKRSIPTNI